MEATSARSALEGLAFVAGLEPAQLDRLAGLCGPVAWEEGAAIFREGDGGSPLYLVERGRVAIEVTVPGRGRVTILTAGPGEVFGWSSLFDRRPKTAAARAVAATTALAFDAEGLEAACDADPRLGYALARRVLRTVADRLKATRMQFQDMLKG